MSIVEVLAGSAIAFFVALWANYSILPMFGFEIRMSQSVVITVVFTIIGIGRQYLVRRFFASYVKRFSAWCQEIYDGLAGLRWLS